MLQCVQSYFFGGDYRDALDHLLRDGEPNFHGKPTLHFRHESPSGPVQECFVSEGTCIGHAACLVATVYIQMGENYPGRQVIPIFEHGEQREYDVCTGMGMLITLDRERQGECKASLWLEADPRIWLRQGQTPLPVRLDQQPDLREPDWKPTLPGNVAIAYCQQVWRNLIGEIDAHLRQIGVETPGGNGNVKSSRSQERAAQPDRLRLEDRPGWESKVGKVTEYETWLGKGLSEEEAAKRVKYPNGYPIPRSTLNGWLKRVHKQKEQEAH